MLLCTCHSKLLTWQPQKLPSWPHPARKRLAQAAQAAAAPAAPAVTAYTVTAYTVITCQFTQLLWQPLQPHTAQLQTAQPSRQLSEAAGARGVDVQRHTQRSEAWQEAECQQAAVEAGLGGTAQLKLTQAA
jgi:hypothetical protein